MYLLRPQEARTPNLGWPDDKAWAVWLRTVQDLLKHFIGAGRGTRTPTLLPAADSESKPLILEIKRLQD